MERYRRSKLAILITAIAIILDIAVAEQTKLKYIHGSLAPTVAESLKPRALAGVKGFAIPEGPELPRSDWYHPIDYAKMPRFADMARLILAGRFKGEMSYTMECTAFYIGKDLLATAAHCLYNPVASIGDANLFAFVHQRYDPATDLVEDPITHLPVVRNEADVKKRLRVVVEWWFPADYMEASKKPAMFAGAVDYAFVRVSSDKEQPESYFTLKALPDLMITNHLKVAVAGFPDDFVNPKNAKNRIYAPVYVKASLHRPAETEVRKNIVSFADFVCSISKDPKTDPEKRVPLDQTADLYKSFALKLPELDGSHVIAMGDKGTVTTGASGGPFVLLNAPQGQERDVYGIDSWSFTRLVRNKPSETAVATEQEYLRPMGSVRITEEMVKIQDHLRKNKDGGSFIRL